MAYPQIGNKRVVHTTKYELHFSAKLLALVLTKDFSKNIYSLTLI